MSDLRDFGHFCMIMDVSEQISRSLRIIICAEDSIRDCHRYGPLRVQVWVGDSHPQENPHPQHRSVRVCQVCQHTFQKKKKKESEN